MIWLLVTKVFNNWAHKTLSQLFLAAVCFHWLFLSVLRHSFGKSDNYSSILWVEELCLFLLSFLVHQVELIFSLNPWHLCSSFNSINSSYLVITLLINHYGFLYICIAPRYLLSDLYSLFYFLPGHSLTSVGVYPLLLQFVQAVVCRIELHRHHSNCSRLSDAGLSAFLV